MSKEIKIFSLNSDNATHLIDFLGGIAYDHAPHWSTCYCQFYHTDCDQKSWKARDGATNKADALKSIEEGRMKGYLAYSDSQVIGWLNANDALAYPRLYKEVFGSIGHKKLGLPICYVIHPDNRGLGVAKMLLKRAISDFRAKGYEGMLALPIEGNDTDHQLLYRGPIKMYESLGFRHTEAHDDLRVMRLNYNPKKSMECHVLSMTPLNRERTVRVWLPPGYDESSHKYPVIYMHDGQNLFDQSTAAYGAIWDAHLAVEDLMAQYGDGFHGAIIVGIDNAPGLQRLDEYSPWFSQSVAKLKDLTPEEAVRGGEGEQYGRYLVETLKPWVDANYRTKPDRESTVVAGSSMGGLISLYLGATYPQVFSGVGAFSTAAWFAQEELVNCLEEGRNLNALRWYLDVGTKETSNEAIESFNQLYIDGTIACKEALETALVQPEHIKMLIVENGIHNERDWAIRLPEALKWLLKLE